MLKEEAEGIKRLEGEEVSALQVPSKTDPMSKIVKSGLEVRRAVKKFLNSRKNSPDKSSLLRCHVLSRGPMQRVQQH